MFKSIPLKKNHQESEKFLIKIIIVGDISGLKCQATLWKLFANLEIKVKDILFIKTIIVNLYNNNICLSTIDDSIIGIHPKENFKELNDFKNFLSDGIKEDTFKIYYGF